jgi:hypothetical protein
MKIPLCAFHVKDRCLAGVLLAPRRMNASQCVTMKRELADVRRAAKAVASGQSKLEDAIRAASAAGASLRVIGREADLSYEQIRRILAR